MKNQKGFIQIPLLIAIIVGVLVIGSIGYVGVKQYQNLKTAQLEIEKLKEQGVESRVKQEVLEQKVKNTQKPQSQNTSISAEELAPYLNGIVRLDCGNVTGSGSLWNLSIGYIVLTNAHVLIGNGVTHCAFWVKQINEKNIDGFYVLEMDSKYRWNNNTDVAAIRFNKNQLMDDMNTKIDGVVFLSKPIKDLNYGISALRKCPLTIPTGSPVVLIGYPASTITKIDQGGYTIQPRTITNGIISAFDDSVQPPSGNLPYTNYYVSAKIDSGNSGGVAFSKDNNGLCLLGIPTWVSFGNYETQGIVQNIHNIFYQK